jgi:hypothetical protein
MTTFYGEPEPVAVIELDAAEGIVARLMISRPEGGSPKIVVAIHDPKRAEPGCDESEVYALTLGPAQAWHLGSALTKISQRAW